MEKNKGEEEKRNKQRDGKTLVIYRVRLLNPGKFQFEFLVVSKYKA